LKKKVVISGILFAVIVLLGAFMIHGLPPVSDAYVAHETDNTVFESNPIDSYFSEMASKIVPTTTVEMVEFELIITSAWEAEMENCYDILKGKTKSEYVRGLLDDDKNSYVAYIMNNGKLSPYFSASDAFSGNENVSLGRIASVLSVSARTDGYRQKTVELIKHIQELDETHQFAFSESMYADLIKQTFPEQWGKMK